MKTPKIIYLMLLMTLLILGEASAADRLNFDSFVPQNKHQQVALDFVKNHIQTFQRQAWFIIPEGQRGLSNFFETLTHVNSAAHADYIKTIYDHLSYTHIQKSFASISLLKDIADNWVSDQQKKILISYFRYVEENKLDIMPTMLKRISEINNGDKVHLFANLYNMDFELLSHSFDAFDDANTKRGMELIQRNLPLPTIRAIIENDPNSEKLVLKAYKAGVMDQGQLNLIARNFRGIEVALTDLEVSFKKLSKTTEGRQVLAENLKRFNKLEKSEKFLSAANLVLEDVESISKLTTGPFPIAKELFVDQLALLMSKNASFSSSCIKMASWFIKLIKNS